MRPADLAVDEKDTVWPGMHRFEEAGNEKSHYGVTWWDPRALTLGVPQSFGIRQEELLKESKFPEILRKDLEAYQNWRTRWDGVKQQASQASVNFCTARDQAHTDLVEFKAEIEVIEVPRDVERNDESEATAAVATVKSVLAHPFMSRARETEQNGQCRRETPVTVTLADGTLVEGVLDLAFCDNGKWTVVDFKTDRELDKELERYKRQVALYALSIERATGQACVGKLMKI